MNTIRDLVDDLNAHILRGEILPAFERYYHDDVVMTDIGQNAPPPRVGKDAARKHEEAFVGGITAFRNAAIKSLAVDEASGTAFVEWTFDFTHSAWGDQAYDQVAVQRWQDGKIVEETFYHA